MMKRVFLPVLLVIVAVVGFASGSSSASGPAMWRLETETAKIYFLGSFHILPHDTVWQDERVDEAITAATSVVFEIDDVEMMRPEAAVLIQKRALLPAGEQLADLIKPETYAMVQEIAPQVSIPMTTIDRAKPWYAGLMLVIGYMITNGFSPDLGVDKVLQQVSRSSNKQLLALETLEQQLDALDSLSTADPDAVLLDTLRYLDKDSGILDEVVSVWQTGNVEALEPLMFEDVASYGDAYSALITDRNRAWVEQIEGFLTAGGTYFIVVGAAHLVGDDSVITMLEEKGFRAERF